MYHKMKGNAWIIEEVETPFSNVTIVGVCLSWSLIYMYNYLYIKGVWLLWSLHYLLHKTSFFPRKTHLVLKITGLCIWMRFKCCLLQTQSSVFVEFCFFSCSKVSSKSSQYFTFTLKCQSFKYKTNDSLTVTLPAGIVDTHCTTLSLKARLTLPCLANVSIISQHLVIHASRLCVLWTISFEPYFWWYSPY